jgi:hypothetical protein
MATQVVVLAQLMLVYANWLVPPPYCDVQVPP